MLCRAEKCPRRGNRNAARTRDCGKNAERIVLANERERLRNGTIYLCQRASQYEAKSIRFKWWTPALFFEMLPAGQKFPCKPDISDFFPLPLCLFSPHRLTSHLWISHGLADNSWSPYHGPAAFNMNYKMASQAYQWMTDWMCMAPGQRGVAAQ